MPSSCSSASISAPSSGGSSAWYGTLERLKISRLKHSGASRARMHALIPGRAFEPWARRIATRAALDWLRAQRPEVELTAQDAADLAAAPSGDPGVSAEIRSKTAEAFARLPPRLRAAAILSVVEELPHKEIAAALGISVTAVKLRVFRALRLLRKDLERQGIKP